MNQDMVKLVLFIGNNFAHWRDRMIFLLTTLKVSFVLYSNPMPIEDPKLTIQEGQPSELKGSVKRRKYEDDELLFHGHI